MPGCADLIDPFFSLYRFKQIFSQVQTFFRKNFFFILNANMFLKNKKRANWSNNIVKTMYNFY